MKFDPNIHHRRSIRLQGYDYTQPGAYFITIVTYQRQEIFGVIKNEQMHLSKLGEIAQEEWFRSPEIRTEIRLFNDEFVVMPNHIHGIVWIVGADGVRPINTHPNHIVGVDGIHPTGVHPTNIPPNNMVRVDSVRVDAVNPYDITQINAVGADGVRPTGVHPDSESARCANPPSVGARRAPLHQRASKSLSSFVAGYKSAVTGRAKRDFEIPTIWQRNFYEHIIRNEAEQMNIWNYIDVNPQRWLDDQLHPSAPPNKFNRIQK